MNGTLRIWVVGGDRRQAELARLLARDGHTVLTYALGTSGFSPAACADSLTGMDVADCVIFPLPLSTDGVFLHAPLTPERHVLSELFQPLNPQQFLCGGRIIPRVRMLAQVFGLTLHDYFDREELTVANAVPTAEGALQLAMEHLPITVHGARVLVTGFGRVGQITAQRFAALGARVSVAARRPEAQAMARAMGLDAFPPSELARRLVDFDLAINTVPARLFGHEELAAMRKDCPILELASHPGGADTELAAALGITLIHAPGLPGKVAPVTAAAAIQKTLCHMWREQPT